MKLQSNIEQSKEQSKFRHDVNAKDPSYAEGDRVLLKVMHRTHGVSKKLTAKWNSPYYVTRLVPNSTFKLHRCSDNLELKPLVHADRLKRFIDSRDYRPPPTDEETVIPDMDDPDLDSNIDQQPDQETVPPDDVQPDPDIPKQQEDRHFLHNSQIPGPSTQKPQNQNIDNSVPNETLSNQPEPSQPHNQDDDQSKHDYEALRLLKH